VTDPILTWIKDVSIVVAGVVALITFVTGTWQYIRQNRQTRAQHFLEMRRRFLEDERFRVLLNLLASRDPGIRETPIQDRRNLVGFLEEVALMVNSRIIKPEVAHYMFGYYVNLIAETDEFWEGLEPKSEYWRVYWDFVQTMKTYRAKGLTPLRY
jgi:hypothetical protein